MIEPGVHDFDAVVWKALFAPVVTPDALVQLLHTESTRIGSQPAVKEVFVAQGPESWPMPHAAFVKRAGADYEHWRVLVNRAGVQPG